MALKDWPETKFALLCISKALPSRSDFSTTSEATDTRGPTGCYCSRAFCVFGVCSGVVHCGHRTVNFYTACCLATTCSRALSSPADCRAAAVSQRSRSVFLLSDMLADRVVKGPPWRPLMSHLHSDRRASGPFIFFLIHSFGSVTGAASKCHAARLWPEDLQNDLRYKPQYRHN